MKFMMKKFVEKISSRCFATSRKPRAINGARMVRYSVILSALVLSGMPSWATCPTSISKLAGTYVGSGTMYDYNKSLALSEITTITASWTLSSSGSGTMTMFTKTGTTQSVSSYSLSGTISSFDTTTCIATYYMSSSSTSTVKVSISSSGTVATVSDYTSSSGKTRVFNLRVEKI